MLASFFFAFVEETIFGSLKNLAYFSFADINVPFENLIHTAILWDRYRDWTVLPVMKLRLKEIR